MRSHAEFANFKFCSLELYDTNVEGFRFFQKAYVKINEKEKNYIPQLFKIITAQ